MADSVLRKRKHCHSDHRASQSSDLVTVTSEKPEDTSDGIEATSLGDADHPTPELQDIDGSAFAVPEYIDFHSQILLDILSDKPQVPAKIGVVLGPKENRPQQGVVMPDESDWDAW
jgi:hypothetical protein